MIYLVDIRYTNLMGIVGGTSRRAGDTQTLRCARDDARAGMDRYLSIRAFRNLFLLFNSQAWHDINGRDNIV